MILLLSNKWDLSLDFVVLELRRRDVAFLRVNTEDLLTETAALYLPELDLRLSKAHRLFRLRGAVSAVLNRRPGRPFEGAPVAERPTAATQRFLSQQWYAFVESLDLLPDVKWMNRFRTNLEMENKIRQLALAHEMGFRIPETLVTNDREAVREFFSRFGARGVAKALYSPLIEEPDRDSFIFAQEIGSEAVDDASLRLAPVIFQRALTPKTDFRVTVIGERVFAAALETPGRMLDWRSDKDDVRISRVELPAPIQRLCVEYVRRSGLLFGAIDLVLHEGEYYFLEINPNGEWGWLQKPHGIPIAEAICDELTVG